MAISFKHVIRSANKVEDILANKGVENDLTLFSSPLSSTNDASLI